VDHINLKEFSQFKKIGK